MDDILAIPILVLVALLGPVLASFFAARIMRSEKLTGARGSRSVCDHCGHELSWLELIPLLSFLWQRGKCKHCGKRIDIRIFLADALGLVLFSLLALASYNLITAGQLGLGIELAIFLLVNFTILGALLYLAIFDLFTFSIPADWVQWTLVGVIAVNVLFLGLRFWQGELLTDIHLGYPDNLIAGAVGAGAFWILVKISKEKGLGMGDVFLAAIIGAALGWPSAISAFYIMLFSALFAGLFYSFLMRKFKGLQIPLVPFMALSFVLALGWGQDIFRLLFVII